MSAVLHNTEESSNLLPTVSSSSRYGSQPTSSMVMEKNAKKLPQYIAALAATGGALIAGLLLGWTSPVGPKLIDENEYNFEVTIETFSWVGSSMTLGAALICMPIGFLMNLFGRRLIMLLLVLPLLLGWGLLIWAQNIIMMYIARFILGIAAGAFCVTAPIYTGEIAQKDIRGTLGSFFQLMVTIGILVVYIIGSYATVYVTSIICGIVPIIFGIIFFFMPETPVYWVGKGNIEEAVKSIKWLRGDNYDLTAELNEIQNEHERLRGHSVSLGSALSRKASRRALVISLGLMFFQQLSGINAYIFYTTKIFMFAKTGINDSIATILVGVMQVIATFVSVMVVDKLGRRILLLISSGVMAICTTLLGVYFFLQNQNEQSVENIGWLPVACLCIFMIMFSLGFGPVPWLMVGELFASDIKGFASSIAATSNWVLAFIVTKTFINLINGIGIGPTFWIFSAITIVAFLFVYLCVPETKGKSLAEIQQILECEKLNSQADTTMEAKL